MFLTLGEFIEKYHNQLLIIAIVIIVVFFISFSVFKLVIKKHRFNKTVRDLEKRYEYVHALLIGQDEAYLKRIYAISSCNLLYVETYTNFLKEYQFLSQTQNEQAQNALNMLKSSLDKKNGKSNRENIKRNKDVLLDYFNQVEDFSNRLKEALKSEEEAQEKSVKEKETLRDIKNTYFEHQAELKLVENSFNLLFENIDEAFRRYDEAIDCANYEEVNTILGRIDGAIRELKPVMDQLPMLCAKVTDVVPTKISLLKDKYQEMITNGFPLNHLHVNMAIEDLEKRVDNVKKHLKSLSVNGCDDEMDNIILEVSKLIGKFEDEVIAKENFENNVDQVYKEVKNLEDKFIKICNIIPEVKKEYIIDDKYLNDIDVIKYNITRIDTIKRTLDNYIHSNTKQPYSLLDSKCKELKEQTQVAIVKLNEFSSYLLSLENDFNNANDIIKDGYFTLKEAQRKLHELYLDSYEEQEKPKFEELYNLIDEIDAALRVHPVDTRTINNLVISFEKGKEDLLKELETNLNFATITESLVVYANKDRHHSTEISSLFAQIETSFFDSEFDRAYMDAGNATKKIKNTSNISEQ